MLFAALYNDYADEDIPDVDESEPVDESAEQQSVSPSTSRDPLFDICPDSLSPYQPAYVPFAPLVCTFRSAVTDVRKRR